MDNKEQKQLRVEIQHIFDSGVNEIRIFELIKSYISKREKSVEAVKYMLAVWDEVLPKNWREKPDHVGMKFIEAEEQINK